MTHTHVYVFKIYAKLYRISIHKFVSGGEDAEIKTKERDRQTDRQTDRERKRQTDRHTHTQRQTDRDRERHRDRQTDRQTETCVGGLCNNDGVTLYLRER